MKNVFKKAEYQKDKTKFFFVEENRKLESAKVYTDNENYVVVQGVEGAPVWVWTLENLSLDKLNKLRNVLSNFLSTYEVQFTSRKEVYDYLVDTNYLFLNKESYFEMGYLECSKTLKPKKCDGYLDRVHNDELQLLSEYVYLDHVEMCVDELSKDDAYNKALQLLNDNNFYVWRNSNGKLVSYLNYRVSNGCAKLGNVYTPKEQRRKGYCANLVYEVTTELLNENLVPMLYTDYNYVASNSAYKKVGYEDKGYLVNYKMKRK